MSVMSSPNCQAENKMIARQVDDSDDSHFDRSWSTTFFVSMVTLHFKVPSW